MCDILAPSVVMMMSGIGYNNVMSVLGYCGKRMFYCVKTDLTWLLTITALDLLSESNFLSLINVGISKLYIFFIDKQKKKQANFRQRQTVASPGLCCSHRE